MADAELARDVTGPHTLVGQVYNALADHFRQGSAVHKGPSQLVQPSMARSDGVVRHRRGVARSPPRALGLLTQVRAAPAAALAGRLQALTAWVRP